MVNFPMYEYPLEKHRLENSKKDEQSLQEVYLVAVVKVALHHSMSFFVSCEFFWYFPCGRLSWLPVTFLLHVKYTHFGM